MGYYIYPDPKKYPEYKDKKCRICHGEMKKGDTFFLESIAPDGTAGEVSHASCSYEEAETEMAKRRRT